MTIRRTVVVAGLLATSLAAGALAHSGATGIVKERMDTMSAMGKVVKSLSAMMRGDTLYSASAVKDGAAAIRAHAGEAMIELFPEGSAGTPSEARPEIWSDWEDFTALAGRLKDLAVGLEAAADNGTMMSGEGAMAPGNAMSSMMGTGGSDMMGSNGSGMMGGGMMGSGSAMPDPAALAAMPAEGVFNMVTQTCSACHTKFRLEKK